MPLSQVEVVWGDTEYCPYSVGESGSRTTIQTGYAVVEAARDIKRQIAEKGIAERQRQHSSASANPNPTVEGGKVRTTFGAHFVEVEVDTAARPRARAQVSGGARLRAHHESADRGQPDQRRRDHGHRHGAARGAALRPPQRSAADGRLLRSSRADASRCAQHRSHVYRKRRRLRPVGREEHGRIEQGSGGGRGGQRRLQCDWATA